MSFYLFQFVCNVCSVTATSVLRVKVFSSRDLFRRRDHIEDEMGGTCSTHGTDEKCVQYFGWKT